MKVNCPNCDQKYNIDESMYGQELQCRTCDESTVFQAPKNKETTKINCPACNQKYKVNESQYGQKVRCKMCDEVISIEDPNPTVRTANSKKTRTNADSYINTKKSSFSTIAAGITVAALIGGGYFAFISFNKEKAELNITNTTPTPTENYVELAPITPNLSQSQTPRAGVKVAPIKVPKENPKDVTIIPAPKAESNKPTEPELSPEEFTTPEPPQVVSISKHSEAFTHKVVPFFKKHCVSCHGPDKEKGSLRVDQLVANLDDNYTLGHLQNIVDEMTVQNMPPEEEPQPDATEVVEIIKILTGIEREVKERHSAGGGRPVRRLTRTEFLNTTADLLGIRTEEEGLPDDIYIGEFETKAKSLFLTDMHINLYMDRSREIVKRFIASRNEKPGLRQVKTTYSELLKRSVFAFNTQDVPSAGHLTVRTHWWVKDPGDENKTFIGPAGGGPSYSISGTKSSPQVIEFTIDNSTDDITWAIIKAETPSKNKLAGGTVRENKKARARLGRVTLTDENLITVQQGVFEHPVILGKIEHIKTINPQPYEFFEQYLKSSDRLPDSAAYSILGKFAALVKRGRKVESSYVRRLNDIFLQGRKDGMSFWEAIEEPMALSLTSIDSILHFEDRSKKSREVSGLELANRLSYMLWRSAPDAELVRLGRSGELLLPETKAAQIKRMMENKKFDRFINDFTDQWLELPRQEEIAVNHFIYKEFDPSLKPHMRNETVEFISHIIKNDLPILNIIDSNFLVLNEPMARHYGINGITGNHFRPVKRGSSPAEQARGGILTHAGLLMQGTTGDRTSIVERGAFIARKIINRPPGDPPPLVEELPTTEAETATMTGAELVKMHAKAAQCANCHAGIDPLGMGLEEFDVVGLIRKEEIRPNPIFETLNKRARRNPKNRSISVHLDSRGRLYDGQRFNGATEMKRVLLSKKRDLAKGYIMALLSYTNGREAGLTDAAIVDKIIKETSSNNYPARTIIEKVANSEVMLRF